MITVTRSFGFDYGHRVLGHESKCKYLHGHRGTAEVTVKAPQLDELGRVVDFGCLKDIVGGWIDRTLDHNMILNPDDPLVDLHFGTKRVDVIGRTPFVLEEGNPTAENIAKVIFGAAKQLLPKQIKVVKVRLYETPNCYAEYEG